MQTALPFVTETEKQQADSKIREMQRKIEYDLRDFTIGFLVQEFRSGVFYIPDYQREFVWSGKHQSRFIESVILGLPIPFMFVAEIDDGRLEIVDGAQRIQTLEAFLNGDLRLNQLERLDFLNEFTFSDLPLNQQRKLENRALRMIVLEEATTAELRAEIFNRINTSGVRARASEVRRGAFDSPMMRLVRECSSNPLFLELCPISEQMLQRREAEELVLRFFAYADNYKSFRHDVDKFLDQYLIKNKDAKDRSRYKAEFDAMLRFVKRYFPAGFAKNKGAKTTPRVRFEAISVGVILALREASDLIPAPLEWLESTEFKSQTTTHASNSGPRLRGRVEFVRDNLLGRMP